MNIKSAGPVGLVILTSVLITIGCAGRQPASHNRGDDDLTFDGLRRIENPDFAGEWIKPGAELARYNKILLATPNFHYRAMRGDGLSTSADFEVPEQRRDQFERIVTEAFEKELAKSKRYEVTRDPGPDVLLAVAALYDVVSHVPPDQGERSQSFINEIGDATLVAELRDSQSNEVLARVVERRTVASPPALAVTSEVGVAAEIQNAAERWARKLRELVDALYDR